MSETIEFMSAVLIASENPERLAKFYKEVIGLPLEEEQHGQTDKHYGCGLGDLHFAIHPVSNFKGINARTGCVKLAFNVFHMEKFVSRVESHGAKLEYPPADRGFALMTSIADPDGNLIEITQLSNRWMNHLSDRKEKGIDIVARWKALNGK